MDMEWRSEYTNMAAAGGVGLGAIAIILIIIFVIVAWVRSNTLQQDDKFSIQTSDKDTTSDSLNNKPQQSRALYISKSRHNLRLTVSGSNGAEGNAFFVKNQSKCGGDVIIITDNGVKFSTGGDRDGNRVRPGEFGQFVWVEDDKIERMT